MIPLGIKIQPAKEFATGADKFLPAMFLNNTTRSTSKVIVMIACFCPSLCPGYPLSVWTKIISEIAVFYKFISINLAVTVGTVICTILSLLYHWFQNISIGIQQISSGSFLRDNCGNYATLIIFTDVCRNISLFKIQPALSLSGIWAKPSIVEHFSGNVAACRIKIIQVWFAVNCEGDLSCLWLTFRIEAVIILIDLEISGICACCFCFRFKLCNCLQITILIVVLEICSCPFPYTLLLLAYCRCIWSYCFSFTSGINNSLVCSCKIRLICLGFCFFPCGIFSCWLSCIWCRFFISWRFFFYLSLSSYKDSLFIKQIISCMSFPFILCADLYNSVRRCIKFFICYRHCIRCCWCFHCCNLCCHSCCICFSHCCFRWFCLISWESVSLRRHLLIG